MMDVAQLRRSASGLARARTGVQELRKYVALNYVAIIKAAKKRNKHLQVRGEPADQKERCCMKDCLCAWTHHLLSLV